MENEELLENKIEETAEPQDAETEAAWTEEQLANAKAIAEALVFASGEPVKIESIAIAISAGKRLARRIMEELIDEYEARKGGIILRRLDNSYTFCSRPDLRENLRDFFEKPSHGLSRAAMETLSIIAYNQPITRGGIEYVRGVNSDGVLVRLIERDLVEECGRSANPGHPILYGTTVKFLQAMGIENIKQLPPIEKIDYKDDPLSDQEEVLEGISEADNQEMP